MCVYVHTHMHTGGQDEEKSGPKSMEIFTAALLPQDQIPIKLELNCTSGENSQKIHTVTFLDIYIFLLVKEKLRLSFFLANLSSTYLWGSYQLIGSQIQIHPSLSDL